MIQHQNIIKKILIAQLEDMESDALFQQEAASSFSFKIPSNALTPIALENLSECSGSIAWLPR
jgi:hypothetical protein